ncbi:hypothetical protein SCA6_019858 [Theobroma cacao]
MQQAVQDGPLLGLENSTLPFPHVETKTLPFPMVSNEPYSFARKPAIAMWLKSLQAEEESLNKWWQFIMPFDWTKLERASGGIDMHGICCYISRC